MPEPIEFPVKDQQLETDEGRGWVKVVIGPLVEEEARALAAVAALGKLKVILE